MGSSPSPSVDSSPMAPVVSSGNVYWITLFLILFAAVVIIAPLLLARQRQQSGTGGARRTLTARSFFEIPYSMWFLLHLAFGALGVLAVAVLAVAGVLNSTAIAALLGSLFGYVLGGTGSRSSTQSASGSGTTPKRSLTALVPNEGPQSGAPEVALIGSNIGDAKSVSFGGTVVSQLKGVGDAALLVTPPAAGHAGAVDVVAAFSDGTTLGLTGAYTYK
jgi:hypothetical protein